MYNVLTRTKRMKKPSRCVTWYDTIFSTALIHTFYVAPRFIKLSKRAAKQTRTYCGLTRGWIRIIRTVCRRKWWSIVQPVQLAYKRYICCLSAYNKDLCPPCQRIESSGSVISVFQLTLCVCVYTSVWYLFSSNFWLRQQQQHSLHHLHFCPLTVRKKPKVL